MEVEATLEDGEIQPITEWPISTHENHPMRERLTEENHPMRERLTNRAQGCIHSCAEQDIITLKRRSDVSLFGNGKNKNKKSSNIVFARTALAHWWRQKGKELTSEYEFPQSNNPDTQLHHISRCETGVSFLRDERERLQTLSCSSDTEGARNAALGTVEEFLGNLAEARKYLQQALTHESDNREYEWHLNKVLRQLRIKKQQDEMLGQISRAELVTKPTRQVQRVSANDLSFLEFMRVYALTGTPVVITDLVQRMVHTPWTLDHIAEVAGDVKVTLKKPVSQSVEWAGLEVGQTVTVSQYIQSVQRGEANLQYLFDWSLPLHCPQLVEELSIPRYFAMDLLQRSSACSLYRDSWPSLFVAPSGLCSQLHVDAFASNFWMALFEGKKRWTFYRQEDVPYLYPKYVHSMDPIFEVDPVSPDLDLHPLMSLVQPLHCDLHEGEVLFVPHGCPHHVENLTSTVAISANFVDLSNISEVIEELEVSAMMDPRAEDLLKQFKDPEFPTNMDSFIEELPWKQFKTWNAENYRKFNLTPGNINNDKT